MPIRDTRLLARALMQRWPINPKMREGIIGALARVLTDPNASHREKTSAAKALMAAEKQNQEDEHLKLNDFRQRILSIAERCGIDESIIRVSQASEVGSSSGDE